MEKLEKEIIEDIEEDEDEAVEAIVKSIDEKIESKLNDVKEHLDNRIDEIKVKNEKAEVKTLADYFKGEEFDAFAKSVKGGTKSSFAIDIDTKDVGDISVAGSITGELPQAELDTMVSRDPQRAPFIESLVNVGTISSNLDAWIETTGSEGEPLPIAELATLPQKDYDFKRATAEVKKIGVYSKYSSEMIEDLPNLVSEVKTFLLGDLRRVIDAQLLSGDGDDEELTGILENAVTYSAGDFAATVADPNRFDVIETAVAQVVTALHNPNYVILHPTDVAKMNLTKDDNGQYVLPPFMAADGQVISGVRVVSNTGITAGTFLVGDFSKSTVKYRRQVTLEATNTDQDDFIKDRFTVRLTVRLVHRVRENDYEAFVTGSFATAIAALDSSS